MLLTTCWVSQSDPMFWQQSSLVVYVYILVTSNLLVKFEE